MALSTSLPSDCLQIIASHLDDPDIIIAFGASKDARAALRRGVDEAERASHGLTVREAEELLREDYRLPAAALSDRHGRLFARACSRPASRLWSICFARRNRKWTLATYCYF